MLTGALFVPVDFEAGYQEACRPKDSGLDPLNPAADNEQYVCHKSRTFGD